MSDYEKRYNVHAGFVSHYTDDPAEALRLYQSGQEAHEKSPRTPAPFIWEGYATEHDTAQEGVTEVRRHTTRQVQPEELEALIERLRET